MTGTSGLAAVDDPPVSFTTLRIPPEPLVERKIVSRSCKLDDGTVVGTSNACAAKMGTPYVTSFSGFGMGSYRFFNQP